MKDVLNIAKKISTIWKRTYVVWSYNVHTILHKNFWSDIDITTSATPDEISKILKIVSNQWKEYWSLIVSEWWHRYEVTSFRKDIWSSDWRHPKSIEFTSSLYEDAQRRDFTFNAIYFDPITWEYFDPTSGIEDLKNGIIRFIWDPQKRIREDLLRILRYIRLKNSYSLKPYSDSYDFLIESGMQKIMNISKDRIFSEFEKMLVWKWNLGALEELKKMWFFKVTMPQVDNLSLVPWWKIMHKEWDGWKHTMLAISHLNKLWIRDKDIYWATLLHDIWKYQAYDYDESGNVHYYWHENDSVRIIRDYISKIVPFQKKSLKKILWIVWNHIRIWMIERMLLEKKIEMLSHPDFEWLLALYKVDNLWKIPEDRDCWDRLEAIYNDFINKRKEIKLLSWDDILRLNPNLKWKAIWIELKKANLKLLEGIFKD